VNVIRHNRIPANGHAKVRDCLLSIFSEKRMRAFQRGNLLAVSCAESDEVQRSIKIDQLKTPRSILNHDISLERSRLGINNVRVSQRKSVEAGVSPASSKGSQPARAAAQRKVCSRHGCRHSVRFAAGTAATTNQLTPGGGIDGGLPSAAVDPHAYKPGSWRYRRGRASPG
jgi:hypothetical protein